MLKVSLARHTYSPIATLGTLSVRGELLHTIERPWVRNAKNISCIPEGTYTVRRYSSTKYPNAWEVLDVPGRTHILIHVANYATDVEGCIGLGTEIMETTYGVAKSRQAMAGFNVILEGTEEFQLEITQYRPMVTYP